MKLKESNRQHWRNAIVKENSSLKKVIKKLNKTALQIIFITDSKNKLIGTITDGDIRRGLLRGLNLESKIGKIINKKPLIVKQNMNNKWIKKIMKSSKIDKVPVVNESGKIINIITSQNENLETKENLILIMAGGKGARLRPLTNLCPKPLLPLAGKPILEHIIFKARDEGFKNFAISINYLGKMVEDYFKDGKKYGVKIHYLKERTPLGTAGSIGLLNDKITKKLPFIVTNGDVLTEVNLNALLSFHKKEKSMGTMSIYKHNWEHPYGVVKTEGVKIINVIEKPNFNAHINAGVYVFDPKIINLIKKNEHIDMNIFFKQLSNKRKNINAYPIYEPWFDVGTHDQLEIAKKKFKILDE